MADFSAFKITNAGIALEVKVQAGATLNFTKFILGDGTFTGNVKTLTALVNPIMEVPVTRLQSQTGDNSKVSVGFDLSSQDVITGFYLREIGVYAEDPDGGDDILVFYGNAGDTADYIEPSSSPTMTEKMIDIEMYIDDVASITAVIDSSLVYATQNDLADVQAQVNAKAPTNHAASTTTYGVSSKTNYGHSMIVDDLNSNTYTDGKVLSAFQGYVLNQKFSNYLPLSGGTLTGNLFGGNNKLNFSTAGNIEWKENGYGDKFRIIPDFSGSDDANILNIQGTVGGANTNPTNWKTLLQVTAKSGNIISAGYIQAGNGFKGNLDGTWKNYEWDVATNNTSDTWLLVMSNGKVQHRVMTKNINGSSILTGDNVTTAKWGTSRTISLKGAVTGSASIDGSANASISTTINSGTGNPSGGSNGDIYIQIV